MMDARYTLLIQKQFDVLLSEREQYELHGFLAGNELAARLNEHLKKMVEECEQLEMPEELLHPNPAELVASIMKRLSHQQSAPSWFALVFQGFTKSDKRSTNQVAGRKVLRLNNKPSTMRTGRTIETVRARVLAEVAPVSQPEAVSLAEAIKRRMLRNENASWDIPGSVPADDPEFEPSSRAQSMPQPPAPSISQSIDMIFNSSSKLPQFAAEETKLQAEKEEERIQVPEPVLLQPARHIPVEEIIAHVNTIFNEPIQELVRPTSRIPIEELIEHVSNIFAERTPYLVPNSTAQTVSLPPPPEIWGPPRTPADIWGPPPAPALSAWEPEPLKEFDPFKAQMTNAPVTPNIYTAPDPSAEDPLSSGSWPAISAMKTDHSRVARLGTTQDTTSQSGHITSLGKFLLDKNTENAIGSLATSTARLPSARVLSDEESTALRDCLKPIENQTGVAGCLIIGYDGMIITTTLPKNADSDAFSAWALLTYMHTQDVVNLLGHKKMQQLVSRTKTGYLLLADFGQGLLLTVSDNAATEAILPLMKSVRRVTAA